MTARISDVINILTIHIDVFYGPFVCGNTLDLNVTAMINN